MDEGKRGNARQSEELRRTDESPQVVVVCWSQSQTQARLIRKSPVHVDVHRACLARSSVSTRPNARSRVFLGYFLLEAVSSSKSTSKRS